MRTGLELAEQLAALSPLLGEALDRCRAEWAPEEPPATVVLAEIGAAFADCFARLPEEVRAAFFALAEAGAASADAAVADAAATGLIEALVHAADRRPGLWAAMTPLLGPAVAAYGRAWIDFTGGKPPA